MEHDELVHVLLLTVSVNVLCRSCTDWQRTQLLVIGSTVYSVTVYLTNV